VPSYPAFGLRRRLNASTLPPTGPPACAGRLSSSYSVEPAFGLRRRPFPRCDWSGAPGFHRASHLQPSLAAGFCLSPEAWSFQFLRSASSRLAPETVSSGSAGWL